MSEIKFVDKVVDILDGLLKRSYSFMDAVSLINEAHKKFPEPSQDAPEEDSISKAIGDYYKKHPDGGKLKSFIDEARKEFGWEKKSKSETENEDE